MVAQRSFRRQVLFALSLFAAAALGLMACGGEAAQVSAGNEPAVQEPKAASGQEPAPGEKPVPGRSGDTPFETELNRQIRAGELPPLLKGDLAGSSWQVFMSDVSVTGRTELCVAVVGQATTTDPKATVEGAGRVAISKVGMLCGPRTTRKPAEKMIMRIGSGDVAVAVDVQYDERPTTQPLVVPGKLKDEGFVPADKAASPFTESARVKGPAWVRVTELQTHEGK